MKKTIVLANSPIKNGNLGCVALSYSAIYAIDKVMKKRGEDYQLFMPDSGFRDCLVHYIEFGQKKLYFQDCEYPEKHLFSFRTLKKIISALRKKKLFYKNVFKNADYIFDIGQGDSFSDIYGIERFKLIDRVHCFARKYKKKYCFLPQTIGPFSDNGVVKIIADKSIRMASLCMARDSISCEYVKKNVPEQDHVDEFIDLAFLLPYEKDYLGDGWTHVGINVSGLLWNGGYSGNNQFRLKCDYRKVVYFLIDFFLSLERVKVHLVSHVVVPQKHVENDYEVCYNLWKKYKSDRLILAPYAFGPIEIKDYIAGLDFFIGARMHATIAAFSSEVPVVPMAYSRKFNGLFCNSLEYPFIADLKKDGCEEVVKIIQEAYANRHAMKNIINQKLHSVVDAKIKLFEKKLENFFNI